MLASVQPPRLPTPQTAVVSSPGSMLPPDAPRTLNQYKQAKQCVAFLISPTPWLHSAPSAKSTSIETNHRSRGDLVYQNSPIAWRVKPTRTVQIHKRYSFLYAEATSPQWVPPRRVNFGSSGEDHAGSPAGTKNPVPCRRSPAPGLRIPTPVAVLPAPVCSVNRAGGVAARYELGGCSDFHAGGGVDILTWGSLTGVDGAARVNDTDGESDAFGDSGSIGAILAGGAGDVWHCGVSVLRCVGLVGDRAGLDAGGDTGSRLSEAAGDAGSGLAAGDGNGGLPLTGDVAVGGSRGSVAFLAGDAASFSSASASSSFCGRYQGARIGFPELSWNSTSFFTSSFGTTGTCFCECCTWHHASAASTDRNFLGFAPLTSSDVAPAPRQSSNSGVVLRALTCVGECVIIPRISPGIADCDLSIGGGDGHSIPGIGGGGGEWHIIPGIGDGHIMGGIGGGDGHIIGAGIPPTGDAGCIGPCGPIGIDSNPIGWVIAGIARGTG